MPAEIDRDDHNPAHEPEIVARYTQDLDLDLDEPGEELLADYYDKRLEELDLVEKLSAAADALAFENAIMGLQVEQLAFRAALRRFIG
jgi:hypothetical protein